jgi:hypothetical protein
VKAHDINEVARCGVCGANADRTYVLAAFPDELQQIPGLEAGGVLRL